MQGQKLRVEISKNSGKICTYCGKDNHRSGDCRSARDRRPVVTTASGYRPRSPPPRSRSRSRTPPPRRLEFQRGRDFARPPQPTSFAPPPMRMDDRERAFGAPLDRRDERPQPPVFDARDARDPRDSRFTIDRERERYGSERDRFGPPPDRRGPPMTSSGPPPPAAWGRSRSPSPLGPRRAISPPPPARRRSRSRSLSPLGPGARVRGRSPLPAYPVDRRRSAHNALILAPLWHASPPVLIDRTERLSSTRFDLSVSVSTALYSLVATAESRCRPFVTRLFCRSCWSPSLTSCCSAPLSSDLTLACPQRGFRGPVLGSRAACARLVRCSTRCGLSSRPRSLPCRTCVSCATGSRCVSAS